MNESPSVLRRGLAAIGGAMAALLLGGIWLVLLILLGLQLYVVSTNELAVPEVVLNQLERRLAESGLRAQFTRTSLDPTGRILIEHVRVSLPDFPEPIFTARAVYVRLNTWLLTVGRIEPRELRIMGASAAVPAMLAGSGAPEELVRNLDATLLLGDHELGIEQLSARVANVVVSARGTIPLPRRRGETDPRAIAAFLQQRFPGYCRQAIAAAHQLEQFEKPVLDLDLAPSGDGGVPAANVHFLAARLQIEKPVAVSATMLEATTRVLFLDGPSVSRADVSAREINVRADATIQRLRAVIFGRLRPGDLQVEPRAIEAVADAVTAFGISADALSATLYPRPLPLADAALTLRLFGEPLDVQAEADIANHHARLRFNGAISPAVLTPISERLDVDVRKYFDFAALDCAKAEVRLGDGWKFEGGSAQVFVQGINAYGVRMDSGHATVEFDGRRFHSPDAFARLGANFAYGSYEQDLRTLEFRFLLHGRLRPLEISEWFRAWWSDFFQQLEFPALPPTASVDVAGRWREPELTTVFVFADAASPVLRHVAFDQVRTRLFIRPAYFDGLEVLTRRGAGTAHGSFTLRLNPTTHDWERFDLKIDSSHELGLIAQAIQPLGAGVFTTFQVTGAPELRVDARFDGPGAAGGEHQNVRLDARTAGEFKYHQFPLQDVSFTALVRDDTITIDQLEARFGGGTANAHARLSGPAGHQQLGFDINLKNANLGEVAAALEQFFSQQQGRPPGAPGKFVQQKANVRLDLGASAEGRYTEPFSFKGSGNAVLQGAEIGEVPLLGALSELFTFTALRFTSLRANFKIEGNKIAFPEVALRGDNSAVDARGDYWLDRRELEFHAKVFPFQESGNLLKSVVGAVLTPLSNALEVKLTGTLQKPQWAFVLGPTNFLRSLAPEHETERAKAGSKSPHSAASPSPPATVPVEPSRAAAPGAP